MADIISSLQAQIQTQLASINSTLSSNTATTNVQATLTSSASTLQGFLDKILTGQVLTPADQAALTAALDTSQKAILAASANTTQIIIGATVIALLVGTALWFIFHKKKKAE